MKTKKMVRFGKTIVAGFAAFMMLAESCTAFACPAEAHAEEAVVCETEEHDGCGEVILCDAQFVDEDGNIYPVNGVSGRVICLKHHIVDGYLQNHIKNDDGSCTVKTYKATQCLACNTIWLGDLFSTSRYTKCPH